MVRDRGDTGEFIVFPKGNAKTMKVSDAYPKGSLMYYAALLQEVAAAKGQKLEITDALQLLEQQALQLQAKNFVVGEDTYIWKDGEIVKEE